MEQSKVPPEAQSGGVELSLATKVQTLRADLVKERARAVAASEHFYAEYVAWLTMNLRLKDLCSPYKTQTASGSSSIRGSAVAIRGLV